MQKYNHKKIEAKWQKYWEEHKTFVVKDKVEGKKNLYILDMFPYPSGAGLHVGHPEGYTATDILTRYFRMKNFNVLHPMGWDAFGLPAENYAIKEGVHPEITTKKNIKRFTKQIKSIGLSYDWSRELATCDPEYYKWTQWLFLLMYKNGLAYKKEASVNWCPKDNTVLANEQVVNGACERCGTKVIQKMLSQWFFKITDYTERLLNDLDKLDWPTPIKTMQRNWISRKEGINITYEIKDREQTVTVFTTRPDTNFGATFVVIGPEHPLLVSDNPLKIDSSSWQQIQKYKEKVAGETELDRTALNKVKTGVFTGLYCVNSLNNYEMPLYVADYVLGNVGTGAVVGVPGHDTRDFEFAKTFKIPVKRVVVAPNGYDGPIENVLQVQEEAGTMVNSDFLNGMDIHDATVKIMDYMEEKKYGERVINYKLRDWLISRQRYWGAPIPIIYCKKCGKQPVPEKDLPIELPTDVDFRPSGESPLARSKSFHKVKCPNCKGDARRDSDTMDTFVDSSWYYLRYADPKNKKVFADKEKLKFWLPVDIYVGGAEHAVLHLLYSRFVTKVLKDLGYVNFDEPFVKLRNQGLILGPDGEKMSKSRGNVINPDDVIAELGADSLRLYEMFMGPLEDSKPWSTQGMIGVKRFLDRVWNWVNENSSKPAKFHSDRAEAALNRLTKKITEDIENYSFNTAISSFMEFYNKVKDDSISHDQIKTFLKLLYPFAPHVSEELHEILGGEKSLQLEAWPVYDTAMIVDLFVDYVVQINGKLKAKFNTNRGSIEASAVNEAKQLPAIQNALAGKKIKRIIFVQNKLINFVI